MVVHLNTSIILLIKKHAKGMYVRLVYVKCSQWCRTMWNGAWMHVQACDTDIYTIAKINIFMFALTKIITAKGIQPWARTKCGISAMITQETRGKTAKTQKKTLVLFLFWKWNFAPSLFSRDYVCVCGRNLQTSMVHTWIWILIFC